MALRYFTLLAVVLAAPATARAQDRTLFSVAGDLSAGRITSEKLVANYLKRIDQIDRNGPKVNAVLAINPDALAQARVLDGERKRGKARGPLHGVPILVKDNIETADNMPTTAGSLALKDNVTRRDAPMIARLRAAGAIILGKTNLSEWANIRSDNSTSGWSAVGGLTRNPHALDRNTCGSSAGSGAAMAAGLASATIGTETDGSIVCPSSINGVVGFKPTVGLVSRTHVVPISHSQDTAGPMTATVRDAAMMLSVMAGTDDADAATAEADKRKTDYVSGLTPAGLKGVRLGLVTGRGADTALLNAAKARLEAAGAMVIPVTLDRSSAAILGEAEFKVLLAELKADLAKYLSSLPAGKTPHRTLADLIAFNAANKDVELQHFGQDTFEQADKEKTLDDPAYRWARALSQILAGPMGIDKTLADNKVDLIIAQTNGPAWLTTLGKGDTFNPPSASQLPAVAGYPHLTVPMGASGGLPVGLSFIGPKWSDALVLKAGHAFEVAGPLLRITPRYAKTLPPNAAARPAP
jgi:amidase